MHIQYMSDKNRVVIFDTTMRDGEQSPGASMSVEEKIQISRVFDEMGIDIIEAGFPISSPGDFEAVSEISKSVKNSIPCGLSRALKKDIDACHESLKFAKRFRIHTFISTSPVHMKPYKGTDYLEEFILELTGQSYYGDASSGVESIGTKRNFFGTKTWGYHHDDVAVQEVVLKLLNVLGSLDRKDPRKVSREIKSKLSAYTVLIW